MSNDFQEIAHCGGKVIFSVSTSADGSQGFQVKITHSRPNAAAIFAVWAIEQGVALCPMDLGGIGSIPSAPPLPNCYPVWIASDSEGMYGHQCRKCSGYWRSKSPSGYCPYCAAYGASHELLTDGQQSYVKQYCDEINQAFSMEDGDHVIDMDMVADAVGGASEKPPFYYSEERQQNKFTCGECKGVSDILGTYGYCSTCLKRNDLQELDAEILKIRDRIKVGDQNESCVKDLVGKLDSFVGRLANELITNIPLTRNRKHLIEKRSLHNLRAIASDFETVFGIRILNGMTEDDICFASMMFFRRNVYEHNSGEVDQQYIDQSGDTSVRFKEALTETSASVQRLASLIYKMADNLNCEFHEILKLPRHIGRTGFIG